MQDLEVKNAAAIVCRYGCLLTVRFVLFIVSTRPASWTMDAKPVKFWPWMAAQRLV